MLWRDVRRMYGDSSLASFRGWDGVGWDGKGKEKGLVMVMPSEGISCAEYGPLVWAGATLPAMTPRGPVCDVEGVCLVLTRCYCCGVCTFGKHWANLSCLASMPTSSESMLLAEVHHNGAAIASCVVKAAAGLWSCSQLLARGTVHFAVGQA